MKSFLCVSLCLSWCLRHGIESDSSFFSQMIRKIGIAGEYYAFYEAFPQGLYYERGLWEVFMIDNRCR